MEQSVFVPASVYNKNLNTQPVSRQDFSRCQLLQNLTFQTDKETNYKLFAKADFLVDKFLSHPRIKLSNSQTSVLDGVETRVLLSDFAQQLRPENTELRDIYFSFLDAVGKSRFWFWIKLPKLKREEAGFGSKTELQQLPRLNRQGGAAYGSVPKLVEASNLPVTKVRQFLHSKLSFTKFTPALRKIERMKAVDGFDEIKFGVWTFHSLIN